MITHRIDAIDIGNRGLFTAIYGMNRTSEVYITSDMRVYDLHQAIYLYLRQEGYTTVFYDENIVLQELVNLLASSMTINRIIVQYRYWVLVMS